MDLWSRNEMFAGIYSVTATEDYPATIGRFRMSAKKLRALVKLIEKVKRKPVYTDFDDEMSAEQETQLPGFGRATFEKFREKARAFLKEHQDHPAIRKLRGA
jgi:type I site-specific restriction endonuclease